MSIQSEINRIQKNVQDTISTIQQTGVAAPEGANSDDLPDLAAALANEKQDKLTGQQGQVVGFNASGEAVAQAAPQAGITQSQADARYLQLSGGTISGTLILDYSSILIFRDESGNGGTGIYDVSDSPDTPDLQFVGNNGGRPVYLSNIATPTSDTAPPTSNHGFCAANVNYVNSKRPKYVVIYLNAAGWSKNQQTVTVKGVSATETAQLIQPMPAIASQAAYMAAGIYCSGQAANSLTFTCQTAPTENITVYVVMQEVSAV